MEHFERLKELQELPQSSQTSNSNIDFNESYQQSTWPIRRDLLLKYEKKLQDYCEKLKAELDEVVILFFGPIHFS